MPAVGGLHVPPYFAGCALCMTSPTMTIEAFLVNHSGDPWRIDSRRNTCKTTTCSKISRS